MRAAFVTGIGLALACAACGNGTGIVPPAVEPPPQAAASLTHDYGEYALAPAQEVASQCVAWTLRNEKALYVSKVTVSNAGAFHHSNWFVVPEDLYPGPDGYFDCDERGFDELASAVAGTVIFAQSTQSQLEEQTFAKGAVIKIPPRHKVVAGVHMLNASNRTHTTRFRMTLGLEHPRDVEVILAPFRLSYYALDIPPQSEARFTARCDLGTLFEQAAGRPIDMKLYWVLPHYHYLGNYFRVAVDGGPHDGEVIHGLDTFNAEANGKTFDPPLDLTGARGLHMTCGFDNPRSASVGWGIGDQEMCVMLGLADSDILIDAWVDEDTHQSEGVQGGIVAAGGPCEGISLERNAAQTLPTAEEIDAPLYVPEEQPADAELPPVLECVDVSPDTLPELPVQFASIRENVLVPSCTFRACHDSQAPAAGLDLMSDPYRALREHSVTASRTSLPLIAPGDPEGSWLYRLVSHCAPEDDAGQVVASMPRNAPSLLEPQLIAKIRAWIATGAPND